MPSPAGVVAGIEEQLTALVTASNRAWWEANVAADAETERRRVDAELELTDFLGAPGRLEEVTDARRVATDSLDARSLELLRNLFVPHRAPDHVRRRIVELEASVESSFASHRGIVAGAELDDNALRTILRTSDSGHERREAWEAAKTVGAAVADRVRELVRLRNAAAAPLGYRDWFALAVEGMEMDEARLLATLDETERLTREPFARWKAVLDAHLASRFGLAEADLRPWHYDDPFFQEVPVTGAVDLDGMLAGRDVVDLARRTFDGIGLETSPILDRSDLYPRAGKCQHAFCVDVDRAGDIRVLANVVADRYWAETMLHELGHGVYDAGFDPTLPWLLRTAHLTVTEGVAILAGRLAADSSWLSGVVGLDGEADALAAPLRAFLAADVLVFTRWALVMTHFERELYANPDADLDAAWWRLVHRFQLVHPPEGRRAPDWASKIHVACAPVYYHTYLYGNLIASQLRATLEREVGGLVGRPAAGRLLRDRVFAPGQSLRWDRLVERATGEPLSARAYAADLTDA